VRYRDALFSETQSDAATMGLEFLERHLVTMDFPGGHLYLKPGKEFDRRIERNMSGIHALRFDTQTVAKIVDEDSPAYAAGIRADDVLIDLNGKSAGDYDMADIRELMSSGDGKELTVTFSHAGDQKTVNFKLRSTI
jgi:C-terminal processing protease CtpA/Prc